VVPEMTVGRIARIAVAAVGGYAAALPLPDSAPPVVAALTGLLVVQVTFYATVRSSLQRVASVVAGVLVATLLSEWVGLNLLSLLAVVVVSLLIGRVLRLGDSALEVAISALLVLAVGGRSDVAFGRVYETLIGAAVGVVINLALAPPVYLQGAGDAIGALAARMAALLRTVSADLQDGWSQRSAARWLAQARELDGPLRVAREALTRSEDSLRLNPRSRRVGHVGPSLRGGLAALEHAAILLRGITRSLLDRVEDLPEGEDPGPYVRGKLSRVLGQIARALDAFGVLVARDVAGPGWPDQPLREALAAAHEERAALLSSLLVDARSEPGIWTVHGSLIAHVDRLLHELDLDEGTEAQQVRRISVPPPP
jgi:hypothetical protein